MKIVAIIAQSVNGRITKGFESNVYTWTSQEDKKHLKSKIYASRLTIMGSTTYLEAKRNTKLNPDILRIVLTSRPQDFKQDAVKGQLEFHNYSPRKFYDTYKDKYEEALLLGGNTIYSKFLKDGLIDEIFFTIEPYLFGKGITFIDEDVHAELQLLSVKKVNKKGTLIARYMVCK